MKVDAGMAQQPPLHRWRAVGRQIVEDDVDVERGLDGRFDLAQKGDEILRPMLGLAAGDHLAGRDIERGEQIQGPMAHVVVGPSLGLAKIHRQDGLRALQRLNLRLLVDREDHRIRRRCYVQPTTSRIFSTSCGSGEILKLPCDAAATGTSAKCGRPSYD